MTSLMKRTFFGESLFDKLFPATEENLEKREHTEKIGNYETVVQMYFKPNGELSSVQAKSVYVPSEKEQKLSELQMELRKLLSNEDYLGANEVKNKIVELENSQ